MPPNMATGAARGVAMVTGRCWQIAVLSQWDQGTSRKGAARREISSINDVLRSDTVAVAVGMEMGVGVGVKAAVCTPSGMIGTGRGVDPAFGGTST